MLKVIEKKLFPHAETIGKIVRYSLSAAASLLFVTLASMLFVEILDFKPITAYPIVLALAYVLKYILNLRYVFRKEAKTGYLLSFVFYVAFFWLFNNAVFYVLVELLRVPYVYAIFFNMAVFWVLRFTALNKLVFR
ncbi:MAG: GtrA family protein [Gammaproteobacteria bacterium]